MLLSLEAGEVTEAGGGSSRTHAFRTCEENAGVKGDLLGGRWTARDRELSHPGATTLRLRVHRPFEIFLRSSACQVIQSVKFSSQLIAPGPNMFICKVD